MMSTVLSDHSAIYFNLTCAVFHELSIYNILFLQANYFKANSINLFRLRNNQVNQKSALTKKLSVYIKHSIHTYT